jgi:hypothetical protein
LLGITTVSAEPQKVSPEEVDKSMLGKKIAVEGSVNNLSRYNQHAFFQIGSVDAVMFSYQGFIFNNEKVRMTGRVDLYEGDLQVVGSKIEIKN